MNRLQSLQIQLNKTSSPLMEAQIVEQMGIIFLNSPKDLNALTAQFKQELCSNIGLLDSNINVKVIILLSKVEKAFCAGANIRDFAGGKLTYESQLREDIFEKLSETLMNIKKPLIVGINGIAFGGGLEIALHGDIIIAAEDAKLGLPELKLGLIPGIGGTQRFAKLAGRVNAMRYILTSDVITAQEAKNICLVSDVVKKEQLVDECMKIGRKIQEKSLYTLIVAKKIIQQGEELGLRQGTAYERLAFSSLFNTQAPKEGSQAFLEKRKADFSKI